MPRMPIASAACITRNALSRNNAPSDALPAIALIDGKASEDGYWYRFRQVAPETAGGRRRADGAGGERIIPNDNVIGANDKTARSPADLVGPGAASEPVVEGGNARIEGSELMIVGQRRVRAWAHTRSHGACACMVRRRRSFGCGGASSRFRNSA